MDKYFRSLTNPDREVGNAIPICVKSFMYLPRKLEKPPQINVVLYQRYREI